MPRTTAAPDTLTAFSGYDHAAHHTRLAAHLGTLTPRDAWRLADRLRRSGTGALGRDAARWCVDVHGARIWSRPGDVGAGIRYCEYMAAPYEAARAVPFPRPVVVRRTGTVNARAAWRAMLRGDALAARAYSPVRLAESWRHLAAYSDDDETARGMWHGIAVNLAAIVGADPGDVIGEVLRTTTPWHVLV